VQRPGQLARAAPEIDDAHAVGAAHQREQIEERLLPLALEFVVLTWIPRIDHSQALHHRGHGGHGGRNPPLLTVVSTVSTVSPVVNVFVVER
jgi:hypothetical protein